jgi:glutamate racemase
MSAARPIGVFDSGLGGLTVLRAMIDLLPSAPMIYFGDTGRFPYGPKPAEEVAKYSIQIADLLLDRDVQMIVVACNSASAAALDILQDRCDVPVVGVIEPGVRAAMRATSTNRVGVIGTVGTVRSGAYQRVASQCAPHIDVVCAA